MLNNGDDVPTWNEKLTVFGCVSADEAHQDTYRRETPRVHLPRLREEIFKIR